MIVASNSEGFMLVKKASGYLDLYTGNILDFSPLYGKPSIVAMEQGSNKLL